MTVGLRYTEERLSFIVDDRLQFVTEFFDPTCTGACTQQFPETFSLDVPLGPGGIAEWARHRSDGWLPFP